MESFQNFFTPFRLIFNRILKIFTWFHWHKWLTLTLLIPYKIRSSQSQCKWLKTTEQIQVKSMWLWVEWWPLKWCFVGRIYHKLDRWVNFQLDEQCEQNWLKRQQQQAFNAFSFNFKTNLMSFDAIAYTAMMFGRPSPATFRPDLNPSKRQSATESQSMEIQRIRPNWKWWDF